MYNKIVPSAEAKESEARQHLHRAGDAAEHAGQDLKTSAHELKEAVTDSARSYGRAAQDRCHINTCPAHDTCHLAQFLLDAPWHRQLRLSPSSQASAFRVSDLPA